jgi:hypothetical protein
VKVGDIIQVYWGEELRKAKVIGFKHGVPEIKLIDK